MWALKQLPIDLFNAPSIWGLDFTVQLSGEDLYLGRVSNRNRPGGVLQGGSEQQGGNDSSLRDVSERKRKRALLITQPSTTTTTTTEKLSLPDSSANAQYDLRFQLTGLPLSDISIFSTILEFLLDLGAQDPYQAVESADLARHTLPVWIYALHNVEPGSAQRLHIYQVVAVLAAIARHCVAQRIYQELIFNLFIDGVLVAAGCVVRGMGEREWCRGLERKGNGGGLGVVGLDMSQNVSVTA